MQSIHIYRDGQLNLDRISQGGGREKEKRVTSMKEKASSAPMKGKEKMMAAPFGLESRYTRANQTACTNAPTRRKDF